MFVLTRDGQVLAHSEAGNVGTSLSLPRPPRSQRLDADTVMFESPGGGRKRLLTHLTEIRGRELVERLAAQIT